MMLPHSDLVEHLEARLGQLECVLLFGSHATGHAGPDSDIDLAVAAARPLDRASLSQARLDLMGETGLGVDLIDLRDLGTSTILLHEAVSSGHILKDANGQAAFERTAVILREYEDFRRRRADLEASVVERFPAHVRA